MNRSIGGIVMNAAVACYLLATGILGFGGRKFLPNANPEIRQAVEALFKTGNFTDILVVILSILAVAAGVFILLRLFSIEVPMVDLLLVILAIVWIVFIIMIDIVGPLGRNNKPDFISWLRDISIHLIVLGGIAGATERFGGR